MMERILETFQVVTPLGAILTAEKYGEIVKYAGRPVVDGWRYRLRDGRALRANPVDREVLEIVETGERVRRLGLA